MIPERGPVVVAEPVFSTGGGGFRSANRPEPPVRGEVGGSRGGPPPGGPSGGGGGPRMPSGGGGGPRMPRGGGGAPAPRPERYWTDYLRIVLPIIGLLLMLSVFIFWVGNIIDGNDDGEDTTGTEVAISTTTPDPAAAAPTATVPAAAASAAPPTDPAAGTASEEPADEPSTAPEDAATEPPVDEDPPAEPTDEVPPDEATEAAPGAEGGFVAGDALSVTQDGVALRPEATTEGEPIVRLDSGTEVTVVSGPESGGDFEWYEVETADGQTGWIASDFLEAVAG